MRKVLAYFAALAFTGLLHAQNFPEKPVKILSPFPTGITPDSAARLVADKLSKAWGQPVVVEPRPGGNGFIAAGVAKRSAPDGYELLLLSNAHLAINPHLFKNIPYDAENDFVPISLIYRAPFFVVLSTSGPYRSIPDLVAAAKADPQKVTYSTPYIGSPPHLGGAMLAALTGTKMTAVHYKEGPAIYTGVANGDISFTVATAGSATPLVKAGKLKLVAIAAPRRLPSLPDVPTAAEAGGPAGYEVESWSAFLAPRGTPPDTVRRIGAAMAAALKDAELIERFRNLGIEPVASSPEATSGILREELSRYGEIVKRAGIQPE